MSHGKTSAGEYPYRHEIDQTEKNKIFEAVAKSSIDPTECNVQETNYGGVLNHESGSTFAFGYVEEREDFWARATVVDGFERDIEDSPSFEDLLEAIPDWADEINQVGRTPDYWAEMRRSRELIADMQQTGSGNPPFTEDEQRQIAAQLQAITEQLKEQFELTTEQTERIDEWRDEVAEASTRMGRKDWKLLAYGTIVNLVVTDTVTPDIGRRIFTMLIQGIAHLLGGSGPPQILAQR